MDNMNKLDLTEILKDCPKGTKFYSRCLGTVEFCKITLDNYIEVISKNGCYIRFKSNGIYQHSEETAEIDLFPSKEQRDWNKWQRPFVDGDIVFYNDTIAIFKEWGDETLFRTYVTKYLCCDSLIDMNVPLFGKSIRKEIRFATEKEKQILFDAIKEYGYKWNDETKTLEKLIVLKFKVGYDPSKFDITTLKPFDKVLVRDDNTSMWINAFYGFYDTVTTKKYPFVANACNWTQCIPYEGNEHLLGTDDDCDEYYKNW